MSNLKPDPPVCAILFEAAWKPIAQVHDCCVKLKYIIVVILEYFQGIEGFKNAKRGTNYAGKVAGEAIAKVIIYCSRFKVLISLIQFSHGKSFLFLWI